MSVERPEPDRTAGRTIPYPTWSTIAAEVRGRTDRLGTAGTLPDRKGWHDLLTDHADADGAKVASEPTS